MPIRCFPFKLGVVQMEEFIETLLAAVLPGDCPILLREPYARMSFTISPYTSVSRMSRPLKRNVSFV